MLILDAKRNILHDAATLRNFDPAQRQWRSAAGAPDGRTLTLREAVAWLQRSSGHPMRAPVAVVGPREASVAERRAAELLGGGLAEIGLAVVCGGRQGVMEAVCRGAAGKGGMSVGLLPGPDPGEANPHVSIAIATGIGEARNAIIARAGFCLVAIGNSHGTLSEVALGLQFGRPVVGLCGAAPVEGVMHCDTVDAGLDKVCQLALGAGR